MAAVWLHAWADCMLVRNMQHVRPLWSFLGSHDLTTRNLESSFSLQLEAPHASIRRAYRGIRVDTGQTYLAAVIERRGDRRPQVRHWISRLFHAFCFAQRHCPCWMWDGHPCVSQLQCLRQVSLRPIRLTELTHAVKCTKHYQDMHVSHIVTPLFSDQHSSCCTFLSFHIPLLPLFLPCHSPFWRKKKNLRLFYCWMEWSNGLWQDNAVVKIHHIEFDNTVALKRQDPCTFSQYLEASTQ